MNEEEVRNLDERVKTLERILGSVRDLAPATEVSTSAVVAESGNDDCYQSVGEELAGIQFSDEVEKLILDLKGKLTRGQVIEEALKHALIPGIRQVHKEISGK
jgi:hypothetical protein